MDAFLPALVVIMQLVTIGAAFVAGFQLRKHTAPKEERRPPKIEINVPPIKVLHEENPVDKEARARAVKAIEEYEKRMDEEEKDNQSVEKHNRKFKDLHKETQHVFDMFMEGTDPNDMRGDDDE